MAIPNPMLDALYGANQEVPAAAVPTLAKGAAKTGIASKLKNMSGLKTAKFGGTLLAWLLAQKLVEGAGAAGDRRVQSAAIKSQELINSPENMLAKMALPQAQEEENFARQALYQHIAGGVLGPSLAKGEQAI
jgi:hypothetical protein